MTQSILDREVFLAIDKYTYSNFLTKTLLYHAHKVCADMRYLDQSGMIVLDLGCGTGHHFQFVKKAGLVGLDIMDEALLLARSRLPIERGYLIKGNILSMPLKDNSVNSVISIGVLEHIHPIEKALSEIRRVLMPGGELIILQHTDGLLMKLGRKLTSSKFIKKELSLNYEKYMQDSYNCTDLIRDLSKYFKLDRLVGIPFSIPSINLNVYIAGRFVKND